MKSDGSLGQPIVLFIKIFLEFAVMELLEHECFTFTFCASWTCQFNNTTKAVLIFLTPTQWEATRQTEIVTKINKEITSHVISHVFSFVPWHHVSCLFVPRLHVAAVLIWVFAWISLQCHVAPSPRIHTCVALNEFPLRPVSFGGALRWHQWASAVLPALDGGPSVAVND